MPRQTIHIDPVRHTNPVPMAAKIGNTLYSSGISGADPATGILPESIEEQAQNCFTNLRSVLTQAGMTPDDVVHVSVFTREEADRGKVNPPWLAMFPDEDNRPARHQLVFANLPFGIQLEVVAIKEG